MPLGAAQLRNRLRGAALTSDPRWQNTWETRQPYSDPQREALSRNGLARRCVSIRIADALRPGWAHDFPTLPKGQAKEAAQKLGAYERRLKARQKFKLAAVWAEEHGHAILVLGVDDGQEDFAKPLDEKKIRSVRWLKAVRATRYEVGDLSDGATPEADGSVREPGLPLWFDVEDLTEPEVEAWRVNSGNTQPRRVRVHWSRVLGPFHTEDGHSRFDEYGEALEDFFSTHDAAERFAQTLSIGNHEVEGWNARTAQDEEEARGRIRIAHEGLAATNNLITDKTEEKFSYVSRPASGVGEILDRKQVMLGGFTGLPGMVLFGLDPAGFSSGREVLDSYYATVAVVFEDQLEPEIRRLDRMILLADDGPLAEHGEVVEPGPAPAPATGTEPAPPVLPEYMSFAPGEIPEFGIRQLPLRVPSATELSEIRTSTWKAAGDLMEKNVADRREVRESLFGAGASDITPTIQLAPDDAREDEQAPLAVGTAQAIASVLEIPSLRTADSRRAAIQMIAPQTPLDLIARIVPDDLAPITPEATVPAPGESGPPSPADLEAPAGDRWIKVAEVAEKFGTVTAGQLRARRAPRQGRGTPGERDPRGRLYLHWIRPGREPEYLLNEVRASFEEGGADLDPATPDTPADTPPPEPPPDGTAGPAA